MLNDHKYGFEVKALVSFFVFLPDFIMILWVGEAIYRLKKNSSQSYQMSRSTLLVQCTTFVMVVFSEFIAFCAYFKTETVAGLFTVMFLSVTFNFVGQLTLFLTLRHLVNLQLSHTSSGHDSSLYESKDTFTTTTENDSFVSKTQEKLLESLRA